MGQAMSYVLARDETLWCRVEWGAAPVLKKLIVQLKYNNNNK